MSNAKLMTPLFYQGNFNAGGKKMRAILVREVSNGTDTYRLWRHDGKPTISSMWSYMGILLRSVRLTSI